MYNLDKLVSSEYTFDKLLNYIAFLLHYLQVHAKIGGGISIYPFLYWEK